MSRSSKLSRSKNNEAHSWLRDKVYEPKKRRTVSLARQSIEALRKDGQPVSIASICAKSKELDPDKKGISESAILNNEEANALYKEHRTAKDKRRLRTRKPATSPLNKGIQNIKPDRDLNRARQRLKRFSKDELVELLLDTQQRYAEQKALWLQVNDELLTWQLRAQEADSALRAKDESNVKTAGNLDIPHPATSAEIKSGTLADTSTKPPQPPVQEQGGINEFDYFTEIEELFIRRRGKHLFLNPVDWSLMERWKEKGVPIRIVLRAIDKVFDIHDARQQRRSVKSLFYCQEEVEAQFTEWLQGQVGAGSETIKREDKDYNPLDLEENLPFTRTAILDHLALCHAALIKILDEQMNGHNSIFAETVVKVATQLQKIAEDFRQAVHPNAEDLEASLNYLEKQLDQTLCSYLSQDQLISERTKAEEQLRPYRSRMDYTIYKETLNNLLAKRLREVWGIPRLSLFYL